MQAKSFILIKTLDEDGMILECSFWVVWHASALDIGGCAFETYSWSAFVP